MFKKNKQIRAISFPRKKEVNTFVIKHTKTAYYNFETVYVLFHFQGFSGERCKHTLVITHTETAIYNIEVVLQ